MERLTDKNWRSLDPADCCGDAAYCDRECNYDPEHAKECNTMKMYRRLAEYEDTGLEPDEIVRGPYMCAFYSNRRCNLDGDWCSEGPGCPYEISGDAAREIAKEFNKHQRKGDRNE